MSQLEPRTARCTGALYLDRMLSGSMGAGRASSGVDSGGPMTPSPSRVLVLDDDEDFRVLLCAFLESFAGATCVAARGLHDVVRQREDVLACELAILDVNLGPAEPSGLDALDWLRANAFTGRVVFLTGHARSHPRLGEETLRRGVVVLEKPVDTGTLLSVVGSAR